MTCQTCDDLDRKLAAARQQRSRAITEAEADQAEAEETHLVLESIAHLGSCPHVKDNEGYKTEK